MTGLKEIKGKSKEGIEVNKFAEIATQTQTGLLAYWKKNPGGLSSSCVFQFFNKKIRSAF